MGRTAELPPDPSVGAGARPVALDVLAERFRPQVLARDELVPLTAELGEGLGLVGLRRGSTVELLEEQAQGARSLALALAAAASTSGMWCAAVGLGDLGLVAAAELGVRLDRFVLVPDPKSRSAAVVGALIEGCEMVFVQLPLRLARTELVRLAARARQRRIVLVVLADHRRGAGRWPEAPDLVLSVRSAELDGVVAGAGRITTRRLEIEVAARRGAGRTGTRTLWLPGPKAGAADLPGLPGAARDQAEDPAPPMPVTPAVANPAVPVARAQ